MISYTMRSESHLGVHLLLRIPSYLYRIPLRIVSLIMSTACICVYFMESVGMVPAVK